MIVCCGEALIDMLPRQLPDGRDVCLPVPGGAIFNTAVALGRLGEDVHFFTGLSTDPYGQQLAQQLEASRVDTAYCARSNRPTTLAFVTLNDGNAQYMFYDENTAGRMLEIADFPELSTKPKALHFGSISLIPNPCASTYEEIMRRLHADAVISLDPNIRPDFIQDVNGYRNRISSMMSMSDIVKVSDEDLDWLEPRRPLETVAREWLASGVKIVVITLGSDGARAITDTMDISVPAVAATVVDTVGAGDTFNAGFLTMIRRTGCLSKPALGSIGESDLRAALEFAAEIAARTVCRIGADPPWDHELEAASEAGATEQPEGTTD